MKLFAPALAAIVLALSLIGCAQEEVSSSQGIAATASTPSMTLKDQVVDVGCAMCMFHVRGVEDCETAIRVNGVVFLASGPGVPDAEDHASGVCDAIRQARVSGKTTGNAFVATSFVMLP